jgi:hypothetical protein
MGWSLPRKENKQTLSNSNVNTIPIRIAEVALKSVNPKRLMSLDTFQL